MLVENPFTSSLSSLVLQEVSEGRCGVIRIVSYICSLCLGPALSPPGPLALSLSWRPNRASSGPLVLSILARASHTSWGPVQCCSPLPGQVWLICLCPPSPWFMSLGFTGPEQASETQVWPRVSARTAEVLDRGNQEPLCYAAPPLTPPSPLPLPL